MSCFAWHGGQAQLVPAWWQAVHGPIRLTPPLPSPTSPLLTHTPACFPQLGQYQAALADYETALALDPGSSYAHYNAGIARDRLGDFQGAVASFSAAIALEGDNPDFYHNRGFSLRKMVGGAVGLGVGGEIGVGWVGQRHIPQ